VADASTRDVNSVRYTVLFATVVCVVCAALIATAAVLTQPAQTANALLYKEKNVLLAAGLLEPGAKVRTAQVEAIFASSPFRRGWWTSSHRRTSRRSHGRRPPLQPACGARRPGHQPRAAGQPCRRAAAAQPGHRLPHQEGRRGGPDRDRHRRLGHVGPDLRLHGAGARRQHHPWPDLLRPDAKRRAWAARSPTPAGRPCGVGRKAYDAQWNVGIQVIKGQAGPPESDPLHVDGLSGSTVTSKAITQLVRFWLGDQGYGKFLKRFREGSQT
jgi:Na+-transporting NADH:ubiquinone oxidoreductase subunit C